MSKIIKIFDTTLRDGEQSPGASMNTEEKIRLALQIQKLGVDVIEAGFAIASPGDFDAIQRIADVVDKATVCSLARAREEDIKRAYDAVKNAKQHRIHTFIATSPIHMQYKLSLTPDEVIKRAVASVSYAKTFLNDVEFSCEDATRSELPFLKEIINAVIEAGATTINIPDTVGFSVPFEYGQFINDISEVINNRADLSVHCHNDLGLGVANSLFAILNGATQVECTVNGLGERAGNAALEEIVLAIKTRRDLFGNFDTNINLKEIYPTSRMVATITGIEPQPNKAIVGKNAFAHESGIHQDGVLKYKQTYEIINASDIGKEHNDIVLGKHSGSHALKSKAHELGFDLNDNELKLAFKKFKELADKKKDIYDDDIRMLLSQESTHIPQVFELVSLQLTDCTNGCQSAAATLRYNNQDVSDAAIGNGAIDAIFRVIDRLSGYNGSLNDYKVDAVTEGKDALARVVVKVTFDANKPAIIGHGLDIDTIKASAEAYISALNSYISMKDGLSKSQLGYMGV